MNSLITFIGTAALLGSALIGGVFFAFSSFVMKALSRVPPSEGIAAMQSINIVVINRSFLGAFIGTAVLSIGMVVLALADWNAPSSMLYLAGATFYSVGTFLVTVFGNIPLNDRLAAVSAAAPDAAELWMHYLKRWTMWNHVRAAAAMLAALMYVLGLMQ